jgi:hypothetical protein
LLGTTTGASDLTQAALSSMPTLVAVGVYSSLNFKPAEIGQDFFFYRKFEKFEEPIIKLLHFSNSSNYFLLRDFLKKKITYVVN